MLCFSLLIARQYHRMLSRKNNNPDSLKRIIRLLTIFTGIAISNAAYSQPLLAQPHRLLPTDSEKELVASINSAYYDAFKQSRENNWVLQRIEEGSLQRGCWVDKDTFYPLGAQHTFDTIDMQCIEVGKSTRVFWPTRWVRFCQQIRLGYGRCLVERFDSQ
jgi:hypothetical protein